MDIEETKEEITKTTVEDRPAPPPTETTTTREETTIDSTAVSTDEGEDKPAEKE